MDYLQSGSDSSGSAGVSGASASWGGAAAGAGSSGGDAGSEPGFAGAGTMNQAGHGGSEPEVPDCTDGRTTADETDTDCGGRTCAPCTAEKRCVTGTDCESAICTNQVCQPPSCNDLALNGDETDHNCGGSCTPCPQGNRCTSHDDCATSSCAAGVCNSPTCEDGVLTRGCPLLVDNTAYSLSPSHAPSMCVDNPARSVNDGTGMMIYACNDQLHQTFWAVARSDGYFALRNALSGKCLEVRDLSTEPGAVIQQAGCDYAEEQLWKPTMVDSTLMTLTSKLSGLLFEVAGDEVAENTQPVVQGEGDGADSLWIVTRRTTAAYVALSPSSERGLSVRHDGSSTTVAADDLTSAHWKVVPGLSNTSWISFQSRSEPGRYLRHANFRLWTDVNDGSTLFKRDATFRYVNPLAGSGSQLKSIESINYPGRFWLRDGSIILLQTANDTAEFKNAATWWMSGH